MPRATNPIADLQAIDEKAEQLAKKRKATEQAAHSFIGKLVFDAGLQSWDLSDLKTGLKYLGDIGPEGLSNMGKTGAKTAPAE